MGIRPWPREHVAIRDVLTIEAVAHRNSIDGTQVVAVTNVPKVQ